MAPVVPNPKHIRAFRSEAAFDAWLGANHARETEIWLRIASLVAMLARGETIVPESGRRRESP